MLNESSSLAVALGVTKFVGNTDMNLAKRFDPD
jgi:hypothetical protein